MDVERLERVEVEVGESRGKGDGKGEKVEEQVQVASLASAAEPIGRGHVDHFGQPQLHLSLLAAFCAHSQTFQGVPQGVRCLDPGSSDRPTAAGTSTFAGYSGRFTPCLQARVHVLLASPNLLPSSIPASQIRQNRCYLLARRTATHPGGSTLLHPRFEAFLHYSIRSNMTSTPGSFHDIERLCEKRGSRSSARTAHLLHNMLTFQHLSRL